VSNANLRYMRRKLHAPINIRKNKKNQTILKIKSLIFVKLLKTIKLEVICDWFCLVFSVSLINQHSFHPKRDVVFQSHRYLTPTSFSIWKLTCYHIRKLSSVVIKQAARLNHPMAEYMVSYGVNPVKFAEVALHKGF
jgi:hypothetical protein